MKRVAIFYATREGHTQRIAQHVAAELRTRGLDADLENLRDVAVEIDFCSYSAAILAASVHLGRHEPEMVRFVKRHLAELDRIPTAFLSVTLSEAGAERLDATPEQRAQFTAGVRIVMEKFFEETGWHPNRVKAIAGALCYSRYNPLVRFVMKRIAKRAGVATDTSRDYEFTDWIALDRFVEQLTEDISEPAASPVPART